MSLDDSFLNRIYYVCGSAKAIGMFWGIILLIILKYRKFWAKKGCQDSARSIVLPIYEPLIYGLVLTLAVELTFFSLSHFGVWSMTPMFTWGVYEFLRDGFPLIFLQRSVSPAAYKRAALWALIPVCHGVLCAFLLNYISELAATFLFEGGGVLWYLCLIAFVRLKRSRESALPYLIFMAVYRPLWILYYVQYTLGGDWKMIYWPLLGAIGLMEIPLTGIWYFTLRQDTIYWRTGAPKSYRFSQNKLLETKAVGLLSATQDAVIQTSLQSMIENSHRQLIDFAYIDIHEEQTLGAGAYSRVYAGTYKKTPVAIKFFSSLTEVTEKTIELYEKETAIMAAMNHPNIVNFYGLCVRPPTIFLIMELCSLGSLYNLLTANPALTLRHRLRMALDACTAIAHIHKLGFVHRDIKSLNFLVTDKLRLKLTDFGLSRKIQLCNGTDEAVERLNPSAEGLVAEASLNVQDNENEDRYVSRHDYMTRRVGTGLWMSPEMLQSKPYSEKTDIYSLALVLWEIFAGVPPFEEVRTAQLQQAICVENVRPVVPETCPEEYRALLEQGWSVNPAARPSAVEMCTVLTKLLRRTIALENTSMPATRAQALAATPRHSADSFEGQERHEALHDNERLLSTSSAGSSVSITDVENAIDINAEEHYAPLTPRPLSGSSSSSSFNSQDHSSHGRDSLMLRSSPVTSEYGGSRTSSQYQHLSINHPPAVAPR